MPRLNDTGQRVFDTCLACERPTFSNAAALLPQSRRILRAVTRSRRALQVRQALSGGRVRMRASQDRR